MANGYIGKISAVVTANTSDLSRKLSGATADVDKFANSVNASLTRLEKSGAESLSKLFTPLQNLERKFKAALDFNIRTEESVAKLRQIVSVSEGINKPLSQAATAFSRLTLEVQGSFLPALNRAQDSVLLLNRKVNETGSVSAKAFGIVERIVARTASAIQRLGEAQRLVSSGPNANSLSLTAPRVSQTLQASAAARQQAAQLPASELADGRVARQVGNLSAVENRIAEVQGRIESLQLRPKVDTVQLEAARRELDRLLAGAERIRAGIQVRVDAQKAIADATLLSERLDRLRENANFSITGTPQNLSQVEAELGRILGQIDRLTESQRESLGVQFGEQFSRVADSLRAGNLPQAIQNFQSLAASVKLVASAQDEAAVAVQRRARAEIEFYVESERLQKQAAADAAAPLIARARAEQEFYAESRRLQEQSAADAAAPLIAQARAQREFAAESERLLSVSAGDRLAAANERLAISPDQPPPEFDNLRSRLIDRLGPSVNALRDRVADLAEPLRATVGPEVDRLNNRFGILAREGVPAASGSVQRLRADIQSLNAVLDSRRAIGDNFLESFGGGGAAGLGLGVDGRALREAGGQIEFVQQRLSRLGAEARGPTLQALQNFREVAQRLFDAGTIDTESGRAELAALRRELAATLSAAGGGSQGRILQDLNRAGDIARGGVDRLSLGLQQAAFAVDDFFSVTGGFEQRIRAVGNNLTQLGFIIGGTTGLFVALGVSLGAQAIVGIVRFINSGQAAEDQTKALNDALERQKTLADQLAESFSNLANAIATRGFSEAAKQARDFARDLESLIKLQRDAREERLVSANPRGREIDNRINSLNRRLRDTTDPGQAAAIQDQIGSLQEERRRLRQTLPGRPAPTRNEVANSIGFRGFQSNAALAQGVFLDTLGIIGSLGINQLSSGQNTRARIGAESARNAGLIDPNNSAAIRAAIDARIQEINPLADQDIGFVSTINSQNRNILAAREERTRLIELQRRFEDSSFDDALRQYVESVNSAGLGLEAAQNEVTKAIEAGVPGARSLGVIIDSLSQQIDNANTAIRKAIDEFNANPTAPGAAERRDAVIAEQQGIVNRTRAQRAAVEAESDRLRRERTLNPERQFDSVLSRTQSTIDRIGDPAGALRTRLRELQFQRDTVQQQLQAAPADPILIRAEENLTNAIRSLEAEVNALDETLNGFEAREARRLTGDAERGRELSLTPGERAAEQVQQGINDIITRFGEVAAETTGLVDNAGRQDAIGRFINDQLRQFAPAVFALADEVTNAVLQGPSRAALGATDASTVEGQRELNRLIRGDDSARDVNLAELQRQTQVLGEIRDKIAEPPPVAP